MQVTLELPTTPDQNNTKITNLDTLLTWMIDHDSFVVEQIIHLSAMKQSLINKEYTISSSL